MSDIFTKIARQFKEEQSLTQPLRMRRDYGSKEGADFLADSTVQVNTGYEGLGFSGPGNLSPFIDYLDPDTFFGVVEDEIIDDIGLEDEMEGYRFARFHEGPEGRKEFLQWKKENPDAAEEFDRQTEINKDVIKDRAKAMRSEDYQENEEDIQELEDRIERLEDEQEDIVEKAVKKALAIRFAMRG